MPCCRQDLRFPLSIVLAHLTIKFLLAAAVRNYLEFTYGGQRTTLSWRLFWSKLAAPGVFSAVDIGLSQWSFEFITVTLYTMTKSTSVIFIYICALFLRIEKLVSRCRCGMLTRSLMREEVVFAAYNSGMGRRRRLELWGPVTIGLTVLWQVYGAIFSVVVEKITWYWPRAPRLSVKIDSVWLGYKYLSKGIPK